jgi:hypothetical protein
MTHPLVEIANDNAPSAFSALLDWAARGGVVHDGFHRDDCLREIADAKERVGRDLDWAKAEAERARLDTLANHIANATVCVKLGDAP